jgi:NAD(P)-dependent dehydrogenase (short-subunit alcohol dehydrogenase family)
VALITGGSIGIGLVVAEEFLKEKADVIICARNGERVEKAVNDLRATYPYSKIYGKSCDVSKLADIESLVAYVKYLGDIDILINNAGTGSEEKSMTAPDKKWYYYWDLHVMAALYFFSWIKSLKGKRSLRPAIGVNRQPTLCGTRAFSGTD